MNEKFSNELLSAFFDGELSPAERAEVERRLAASKTTKQELDQLEQLSALLGQLPRQSAPQEFRSQVMQRIEREMLLPSSDELQPAKRTTTKTPKRRLLSRRWQALSTLVVCVAVVVVTIFLVDSPDDQLGPGVGMKVVGNAKQDAGQLASLARNEGGHRVASNEISGNANSAEKSLLVTSDDDRSKNGSGPAFAEESRPDASRLKKGSHSESVAKVRSRKVSGNKVSSKFDGKSIVRKQAKDPGNRFSKLLKSRHSRFVFLDSLKDAEPGQIVEALEGPPGRVKIVRLTVVDRQAGLKYLQVLLQDHEILGQPTSVSKTKPGIANSDSSAAASIPANQLVCVFVEATDQQLTAAFQQMKDDATIKVLNVDDTLIAMASLDGYLPQSRLKKTVKLPLVPNPLSAPTAASDHKPAPPPGAEEKLTESSGKQGGQPATLESKKITPAAPSSENEKKFRNKRMAKRVPTSGSKQVINSRQLTISLPAEVLSPRSISKTKPSTDNKRVVKGKGSARKHGFARSRRSALQPQTHALQKSNASGAKKSGSAKPGKPFLILFVLTLDESKVDGKTKTPGTSADPSSHKQRKAQSGKNG